MTLFFLLAAFVEPDLEVVVFLGTECPLARLYAGRLNELQDRYSGRVQFRAVCADTRASDADLERFVRDFGLKFPFVKDPALARRLGATRSPDAFVLEAGTVRYRGRIDDELAPGARGRLERRYLDEALAALAEGRPVETPETEPLGCLLALEAPEPQNSTTTFADVAPIFFKRCAACHQPGQSAPFSLTTYDDCASRAEMIGEVVAQNRMPPWHADPRYGRFANDRSLRPEERRTLEAWLEAGCPQGDELPVFHPRPAEAVRPDLVLSMSEPFSLPADGIVEYQYVTLDPGLERDAWIQAVEIRPGNAAVVHHINAHIRPRGAPPRSAFVTPDGDECLAIMVPGHTTTVFPAGAAKRLPRGCEIVLVVHYVTTGKVESDRSSIVLQFADAQSVHKEIATRLLLDHSLRLPPNQVTEVRNSWRLTEARILFALYPHMHLRGRAMRFTARFPDGSEEILLSVPTYDFQWQHRYVLETPRVLPKATVLECTAVFDNTAANVVNPDPSQEVVWGPNTTDEMFQATFETAAADQDLQARQPTALLLTAALASCWIVLRRRRINATAPA